MNLIDSTVVSIYHAMNVADVSIPPDEAALVEKLLQEMKKKIESDAAERAAKICESMVVGGRAWTSEQKVAAEALFTAAKNIRAMLLVEGQAG